RPPQPDVAGETSRGLFGSRRRRPHDDVPTAGQPEPEVRAADLGRLDLRLTGRELLREPELLATQLDEQDPPGSTEGVRDRAGPRVVAGRTTVLELGEDHREAG